LAAPYLTPARSSLSRRPPAICFIPRAEARGKKYASSELLEAQICFHQALPDEQDRAAAFDYYKKGLRHLWDARSLLDDESAAETVSDAFCIPNSQEILGSGIKLSRGRLVEYYCGKFAPWGLQLMNSLIDEGLIDGKEFDIRVLPVYGMLDWV